MLRISTIQFSQYRALRNLTLSLGPTAILVGPNNVGKTSVLEALEAMLGVGRRGYAFSERDVTSGATLEEGLEVVLTLIPEHGRRFLDDEAALFGMHVDVRQEREQVMIAARGKTDEEGVFRTTLTYRMSDGHDDGIVRYSERQRLGFLLMPALRDARREVTDRAGLWARITELQPFAEDSRSRVDELGRELGTRILSELLGDEARARLDEQVGGLVSEVLYAESADAALQFSLTPLDTTQALRHAEIRLRTPGEDVGRPLTEQSVGTQSVALFGLFRAYTAAVGQTVVALGIEEPEAHLHPHATRAMMKALRAVPTQTIVTTHSTAVTDEADPRDIVLLRRRGHETVASSGAGIAAEHAKEIRRYVSNAGSDFLFARAVLLVEGDSERLAIPIFAERAGMDLDRLGISIVAVHSRNFEPFLELLGPGALSVPITVVCDSDARQDLAGQLERLGMLPEGVDRRDPELPLMRAAGFWWWEGTDFEGMIIAAGGAGIVAEACEELNGTTFRNLARTWAQDHEGNRPERTDANFLGWALRKGSISKPRVSQRVAEIYRDRSLQLPAPVAEVIAMVAESARSEVRATAGSAVVDGEERDEDPVSGA